MYLRHYNNLEVLKYNGDSRGDFIRINDYKMCGLALRHKYRTQVKKKKNYVHLQLFT